MNIFWSILVGNLTEMVILRKQPCHSSTSAPEVLGVRRGAFMLPVCRTNELQASRVPNLTIFYQVGSDVSHPTDMKMRANGCQRDSDFSYQFLKRGLSVAVGTLGMCVCAF